MIANDFAEFVSSQQVGAGETPEMWAKMLSEWLRDLDGLYEKVAGFIGEYVRSGSITYSFTDMTLIEEEIGTYAAKRMNIRIGAQQIYLEPIGTLLIGFKGRVDIVGPMGRVPIFLVGAHVKKASDLIRVSIISIGGKKSRSKPEPPPTTSWNWKIVSHTLPSTFMDLDQDSFLANLMKVANA
jgi:hypothetical protein